MSVIFDLWLAAWETALAALATATRIRALSTSEAAAHSAVLHAERELVTKHFTLLLGHEPPRPRASDTRDRVQTSVLAYRSGLLEPDA